MSNRLGLVGYAGDDDDNDDSDLESPAEAGPAPVAQADNGAAEATAGQMQTDEGVS
jgi:hypothetical protein